jgi:hypothetical protein
MLTSDVFSLPFVGSCVPQYIGDPMTEVLRSKLFYARSASMVAIPTFNHISDLPSSDQGVIKSLLGSVLSRGFVFDIVIDSILAKGRYGSQEYFGR